MTLYSILNLLLFLSSRLLYAPPLVPLHSLLKSYCLLVLLDVLPLFLASEASAIKLATSAFTAVSSKDQASDKPKSPAGSYSETYNKSLPYSDSTDYSQARLVSS